MTPVVSTTLTVNAEDGDSGDPRGTVELVATPHRQGASADGANDIACAHCGARLRLRVWAPETTGAPGAAGSAGVDSLRR